MVPSIHIDKVRISSGMGKVVFISWVLERNIGTFKIESALICSIQWHSSRAIQLILWFDGKFQTETLKWFKKSHWIRCLLMDEERFGIHSGTLKDFCMYANAIPPPNNKSNSQFLLNILILEAIFVPSTSLQNMET